MTVKKINTRLIPGRYVAELPVKKNGNWYDCSVSAAAVQRGNTLSYNRPIALNVLKNYASTQGTINFKEGDVLVCYLGFAADIGKGYEAYLLPRSSTFVKKGLILGNSMGLIDNNYNGNKDEWIAVFYCTRSGSIRIGDRLCQITVKKSNPCVSFEQVDELENEDRGGFGSTGN